MLNSKKCIEAARKAEELKTLLLNIGYKLETSSTIKMVYEDEPSLLIEDTNDFNKTIKMVEDIIESLADIDSVIAEDENNPLSKEVIETLRKEKRL